MAAHIPKNCLILIGILSISITNVLSQTIEYCTASQPCTYDCNIINCEDYTIHAETATSLTISNCGITAKYCDALTIHCPQYNGIGDSTDTCIITGTAGTTIQRLTLYAHGAWQAVDGVGAGSGAGGGGGGGGG
eukprot:516283_1